MSDLVAAAEAVADVVMANADEAERERRLPAATVAALVEADLMRMALPAAYGGPEADPLTMLTRHRDRRPGRRGRGVVLDDRLDDRVAGAVPPAGDGPADLSRRVRRGRRGLRPERRGRGRVATGSR